jgi:hypothetical protein
VTTAHADVLGLPCGEDCRWYTVCVDHGTAVGHRTQMLARELAPLPLLWCEDCRIEQTP